VRLIFKLHLEYELEIFYDNFNIHMWRM
jgi:hypothetical protein